MQKFESTSRNDALCARQMNDDDGNDGRGRYPGTGQRVQRGWFYRGRAKRAAI